MELSPVILSTIISAAIAILTLIISTTVTLRKNVHEERSYFEKNLKEKLENIYLPLNIDIKLRKANEVLISGSKQELIYKYGYLLSPELFHELRELIYFENNEPDFFVKEEYLALRNNVIDAFKKDFLVLQSLYNSHFEKYRQKYTKTNFAKTKSLTIRIFLSIALIMYSLVGLIAVYNYVNNTSKMLENPILNAILGSLIIATMLTTFLALGAIVAKFIEWLENKIGKQRNAYKSIDKVPSTGEYQCAACKKIIKRIEYTTFGYCDDHTKRQMFKSAFVFGLWKKLS